MPPLLPIPQTLLSNTLGAVYTVGPVPKPVQQSHLLAEMPAVDGQRQQTTSWEAPAPRSMQDTWGEMEGGTLQLLEAWELCLALPPTHLWPALGKAQLHTGGSCRAQKQAQFLGRPQSSAACLGENTSCLLVPPAAPGLGLSPRC